MAENLSYIDRFYKGELSPEESVQFEKRLNGDPVFADEVGFYFSTLESLKIQVAGEKKKRFREIYEQQKTANGIPSKPVRKLWPYWAAAAVIAGLVLGWYFFSSSNISPAELADRYANEKLEVLGVKMSIEEDEMQRGLKLYNEGKFVEALQVFEKLIGSDAGSFKALEYAGITCYRLKHYDKALTWFVKLENFPGLHANPGKFYHALALMKRNLPGDAETAKQLLQDVVKNNLDKSEDAKELLEKW